MASRPRSTLDVPVRDAASYNAAMRFVPPRRWFRFSLRTFLLAVAGIAVWLGGNMSLVRQRREFIENLPTPATYRIRRDLFRKISQPVPADLRALMEKNRIDSAIDTAFRWPSKDRRDPRSQLLPYTIRHPTAPQDIPWLRGAMGDEPYSLIACFEGPLAERARELFPEAMILVAEQPRNEPY